MVSKLRSRLTYGNVVATVALFVALGGTAVASVIVSSNSQVAQNTISGHKPPSGDHPNLIAGSVNGQDLASGAVSSPKLANGAVSGSKLGANAVTSSKVFDNSLTGSDVNESTLNGSQITGVNASQLGGFDASSYTRQLSQAFVLGDCSGAGQNVGLFTGAVPDVGTFQLHCQTGGSSTLRVIANSGQTDLSFLQEQRNNAAPIVHFQTANDSTGQTVQLADGTTSIIWQVESADTNTLLAPKVATLILNFDLGGISPGDGTVSAQLLIGQASY